MADKILVNVDEYRGLIIDREHLDIITTALWSAARLNYNETELRFDGDDITTIMKSIYTAGYNGVLGRLKAEAENVRTNKD